MFPSDLVEACIYSKHKGQKCRKNRQTAHQVTWMIGEPVQKERWPGHEHSWALVVFATVLACITLGKNAKNRAQPLLIVFSSPYPAPSMLIISSAVIWLSPVGGTSFLVSLEKYTDTCKSLDGVGSLLSLGNVLHSLFLIGLFNTTAFIVLAISYNLCNNKKEPVQVHNPIWPKHCVTRVPRYHRPVPPRFLIAINCLEERNNAGSTTFTRFVLPIACYH